MPLAECRTRAGFRGNSAPHFIYYTWDSWIGPGFIGPGFPTALGHSKNSIITPQVCSIAWQGLVLIPRNANWL